MPLAIKHILCATDGSDQSEASVSFASALAATASAKLTLLAVLPYTAGRGGPVPLWDPAEAEAVLKKAGQVARSNGATNVHMVETKAPDIAEAIVSIASEQQADHIVVGSHGKGALARAFVGSVSSDVVHKAKCPVTVVH